MKLVCVVGPTGCGKTWLGVELAKALRGEVVSCDSMQIYRGMVIGTAAPTEEEMQGVPHHMVGVADPNENYSVARYACDAAMPCSPGTALPAATRTAHTARRWSAAGKKRAARRWFKSFAASTRKRPKSCI